MGQISAHRTSQQCSACNRCRPTATVPDQHPTPCPLLRPLSSMLFGLPSPRPAERRCLSIHEHLAKRELRVVRGSQRAAPSAASPLPTHQPNHRPLHLPGQSNRYNVRRSSGGRRSPQSGWTKLRGHGQQHPHSLPRARGMALRRLPAQSGRKCRGPLHRR